MSRECAICHGSSHGFTVAENEEGVRVTVHAGPCATVLSERRLDAAREEVLRQRREGQRVTRKTAGITQWEAQWEPGRYGYQHILPCPCPKHRDEDERDDVDLYYR